MNGSPSSARSTMSSAKPPCARARPVNHSATGSPTRPGRVLAMMIWSLGGIFTGSVYAVARSVCGLDGRGRNIDGMDLIAVALAVLAFAALYGLIELVDRV